MRRYVTLLLGLVAWCFITASCTTPTFHTVTQSRPVGSFDRIEMLGAGDLDVTVGGDGVSVSIEADRDVIDEVRVDVVDGVLTLDESDGLHWRPIVYTVRVPALSGLAANGSGTVEVQGIDAEGFALASSGSGDVRIMGQVRELDVAQPGSGDLDLVGLEASDVTVRQEGSGGLAITAGHTLAADIAGSGTVGAAGEVDVLTVRLDGSGDLAAAGLRAKSATVSLSRSGDAVIWVDDLLNVVLDGSGNVVYSGSPQVNQRVEGDGRLENATAGLSTWGRWT